MFSLLQGDICPQAWHWKRLPISVDDSKVSASPIWMGDGNQVLQWVHCSSILLIGFMGMSFPERWWLGNCHLTGLDRPATQQIQEA